MRQRRRQAERDDAEDAKAIKEQTASNFKAYNLKCRRNEGFVAVECYTNQRLTSQVTERCAEGRPAAHRRAIVMVTAAAVTLDCRNKDVLAYNSNYFHAFYGVSRMGVIGASSDKGRDGFV